MTLPKLNNVDSIRAINWQDDKLVLLDQRFLPQREDPFICTKLDDVIEAIRDMVVRGAPAIGIAAAFGTVLAVREQHALHGADWRKFIHSELQRLAQARPTAVNLVWAIEQMQTFFATLNNDNPVAAVLKKAQDILYNDIEINRTMGELGAHLIENSRHVLTHCNTGSLATGGYGTALGVIRSAFKAGRIERVYADETRPWLQGSRLTAWELVKEKIPVTLIADSAAAHLMKQGDIGWLIVGADRIAANGDTANKIGTYSAAISARFHQVKVMVVAPTSTIDMTLQNGDMIPIENRDSTELMQFNHIPFAPGGCDGWNPVFDVTPASLIDVIVTEKGVIQQPDAQKMAKLMSS